MDDLAPAWAYAEAELCPHDPRWGGVARVARARLVQLLAPWLVDGVEHVGSTAVPGLAAKPIIDLMASVDELDVVVKQASERLADDGWCYVSPELDRRRWRRFFVQPDSSGRRRLAHVHLISAGHPRWGELLAFRDALRRDAGLARRYEALKWELAERYPHDREGYTDAKTGFIRHALGGLTP